jgi:hypothetical protein
MLHTKTDKGYIVRLERGEDVFGKLTECAKQENITAAEFRAIGAVENLKLGSYDLATKEYDQRDVPGILEAAAVIGNIALVDDEPFLHIHGVFSDAALTCFGGHVFAMDAAVTLEVFITPHDTKIVRELDEHIGLKLCTFLDKR